MGPSYFSEIIDEAYIHSLSRDGRIDAVDVAMEIMSRKYNCSVLDIIIDDMLPRRYLGRKIEVRGRFMGHRHLEYQSNLSIPTAFKDKPKYKPKISFLEGLRDEVSTWLSDALEIN